MKKIIYFVVLAIFIVTLTFSYKIISGKYDKQNEFILKIKETIPKEFKVYLRNLIYDLRYVLIQNEVERTQKIKIDQGLNGDLINEKKVYTELDKKEFIFKEFFLPFDRLDLSYGWKSIVNAKRAHYLDTDDDKTIVVSGDGNFIFFETKNFLSKN